MLKGSCHIGAFTQNRMQSGDFRLASFYCNAPVEHLSIVKTLGAMLNAPNAAGGGGMLKKHMCRRNTARATIANVLFALLATFAGSLHAQQGSPGTDTTATLAQALPLAHAIFVQNLPDHSPAILAQVGLAVLDSGGSAETAIATVKEAQAQLATYRATMSALGAVGMTGSIQDAYQQFQAVLQAPSLQNTKAALVLQRARLTWDLGVTQGVPEALDSMPGQEKSALEAMRSQQRESVRELQRRYRLGNNSIRTLFDTALLSEFRGVRPNDSMAALLQTDPDFAKLPFIHGLVQSANQGTTSLNELREVFRKQISATNVNVKQAISDIGKSLTPSLEDLVLSQIEDASGLQAKRLVVEARRLQNGMDLGNADAGIFLVSTMAGIVDPKFGNDLMKVGVATVEVARIVKGLRDSQDLDGAAGAQLGMAAASGGTTMALLTVAQLAFEDSNNSQSSDALIQEQLLAIQQQIDALGARMDQRFDQVDATLKLIYTEMKNGFTLVNKQLSGIAATQAELSLSLMAQDKKLDSVSAGIQEALEQLRDVNSNLLLAPCQRWKETTVNIAMAPTDFVQCMARLAASAELSANTDSNFAPSSASFSSPQLGENLTSNPYRNIQFLARLAANEGYPLISPLLEPYLGDPSRWAASALVYERLARDWPTNFYGIQLQQAKLISRYGNSTRDFIRNLRSTDGVKFIKTLSEQYESLSEEYAKALRSVRHGIEDQNGPWWTHKDGDRPLPYCNTNAAVFHDLKISLAGISSNLPYQNSPILAGMASSFLPAFTDVLQQLGAGRLEHCISMFPRKKEEGKPKAISLRLIGWFVVPARYDPAKYAALQAKYGSNIPNDELQNAEVEPTQNYLLHDLDLVVEGDYSLPSQFCGIVCSPPIEPAMAAIIADAWKKTGRNMFDSGGMPWASDAQHVRAIADRQKLLTWALENVLELRTRFAKDAYAAAATLPTGCGDAEGQPRCLAKAIGVRSSAIRAFMRLGYGDAIDRNDVLRALLFRPEGLLSEAQIQTWAVSLTPPIMVAATLERRAKAIRTLLADETKISQLTSPTAHDSVERAVSRFDTFIAEVVDQCTTGHHHPLACQ